MRILLSVICALSILLMQGCSTPTRPPEESPLERQARLLTEANDWPQAALVWEQLAAAATAPDRYYLSAAEAWAKAGEWQAAAERLAQADPDALSTTQSHRWYLLQAELALRDGDFEQVRQALAALPDELHSRQRERRSRIQARLNEFAQGPAGRLLAQLLAAYDSVLLDHQSAFNDLARLPSWQLLQQRQLRSNPREQAWLDLAIVARRSLLDPATTGDALRFWWNAHAAYGPSPDEATAVVSAYHNTYGYPRRIAVLLPLNTRIKNAAQAIRDGMLTLWAQLPQAERPEIRFFALDENPVSAVGALLEARDGQFDWVVGPLRREAVQAVIEFPGNTLPLLLLNQPALPDSSLPAESDPEATPPEEQTEAAQATTMAETAPALPMVEPMLAAASGLPVFSFTLLPEDEASASAQLAWQAGHRRALIVHSDDDWGYRVNTAFADRFTALGGEVLQTQAFDPQSSNHNDILRSVLGINLAAARQRRLQGLLGMPLGFTAVPRQDADMVFLGARVQQARQLKPQLRFHDAGHLPVYATTQVYSGMLDRRNDRDLNGVHFPLPPWMLDNGDITPQRSTVERWFKRTELLGGAQFFALGMDIMRLLPYLEFLRNDPDTMLDGASGNLSINARGQVLRQLQEARFRNGRAQLEP